MNLRILLAVSIQAFSFMALQASNNDLIARGNFGGDRGGEGRGGEGRGVEGRGVEGRGVEGRDSEAGRGAYDHDHYNGDNFHGDGLNGGGSIDVISPVPEVIEENDGFDEGNSNNPYL